MISDYSNKLQKKRYMRDIAASSGGLRGTDTEKPGGPGNAEPGENRPSDKKIQRDLSQQQDTTSNSIRGRLGYMQYIHGFIGCVLVVLALIHFPYPAPLAWLPYAIAAVLAFITLKTDISVALSRVLAIATAGMMFFFFALFFLIVPKLEANWYMSQFGWAAVCRILSAFVMIPILSDYSCRLKADCLEARAARRTAFFSVPSHIRPEGR